MYCWCVCFRSEHGLLNCDDICMRVMNKQFQLLKFVVDSVYVDLPYDEISLTFNAVSVSLCCLCDGCSVFVSAGHVGCTRGSGIV